MSPIPIALSAWTDFGSIESQKKTIRRLPGRHLTILYKNPYNEKKRGNWEISLKIATRSSFVKLELFERVLKSAWNNLSVGKARPKKRCSNTITIPRDNVSKRRKATNSKIDGRKRTMKSGARPMIKMSHDNGLILSERRFISGRLSDPSTRRNLRFIKGGCWRRFCLRYQEVIVF